MSKPRISLALLFFISIIPFLNSCNDPEGIVIVLGKAPSSENSSLVPPDNMKLGLYNPAQPGKKARIITGDFFSASSPVVSYDGKSVLFSGRKTEKDPWQIWEIKPGSNKAKQITTSPEHCLFPAYLPDSRIVYSKIMRDDSLKSNLALFRCNADGSGCERITFNPASWYASTVLADGRILAKCSEEFPDRSNAEFMVLRPDGTKAELFYERHGILAGGKALESPDGRIFFTEKNGTPGTDLVSILYNRPFNSSAVLAKGDFIAINSGADGNLLTCQRASSGENYKLYSFNPENGSFDLMYEEDGLDIVDAVVIKEKQLPRKLPSEVDMLVKTGLLVCQDINYPADMRDYMKAEKLGIIGVDTLLGIVEPAPDGSIYLKVIADMPFRLATLDKDGKILRSCNWISLRPNERRGCTGCHEDPEVVPENRIPMAVRGKDPVLIPVMNSKIEEKTVELE